MEERRKKRGNMQNRLPAKESQRANFLSEAQDHVPLFFPDTTASWQPAGQCGDDEKDESCAELTRNSHFHKQANEELH